jgi:AcrR family transcriptional regulator
MMLHEALLRLLASKRYDVITVEDICEGANVGRSTFYAHYTGKDDLLRSALEHVRERLQDRSMGSEITSKVKSRQLGFSLAMFEHARDHTHLHQTLGDRGRSIVLATIRRILCDLVRGELGTSSKGGPPREMAVQYVVGAYMAVTSWWLQGGAKLPPEQVDSTFRRLAIEGIMSLGPWTVNDQPHKQ